MHHAFREHMLFEHRFWLQILGDHSRFIYESLAPKEQQEAERAQSFIESFDTLLAYARDDLAFDELDFLNRQASTQTPLMADHMSREECYYLIKLSEVSDVPSPDCYPARPRVT